MSSSNVLGKKKLADIVVGDRICFKAHQVIDWQERYPRSYIDLSATVKGIIELADNKRQLLTVSGHLRPYPGGVEFELVGSDYDTTATQKQYVVATAEEFNGVSIE